jgi:hypothetical protein
VNPHPTEEHRRALAERIGLTDKEVTVREIARSPG